MLLLGLLLMELIICYMVLIIRHMAIITCHMAISTMGTGNSSMGSLAIITMAIITTGGSSRNGSDSGVLLYCRTSSGVSYLTTSIVC